MNAQLKFTPATPFVLNPTLTTVSLLWQEIQKQAQQNGIQLEDIKDWDYEVSIVVTYAQH